MNKNILYGVIGILVVAVGLFLFLGNGKKSSKGKSGDPMSQSSDPTKSGAENFEDKTTTTSESGPGKISDGVTPAFLLEQYTEWAQYPPHSRPISSLNQDIIHPFKIDINAITMVDSPNDKEGNGYRCHLQPKTWAVIGSNSDMIIKLECRDSSNDLIKVNVVNATVYKEFEDQKTPTHSPDFNDDGRDGDEVAKDGIVTFKWKPMKADWGQMSLEANITYAKDKKAKLTTSFFSSPNKPAEIGNTFRDTLSDGSLVIHAPVIVYKAGNYRLEANLKEEKEGNYLAYATFDGPLKQGTNDVEFLFFGKILRDKGYDGPYVMTNVRGYRVNLPIDPQWLEQGEEGLKKIQAAKTTEPDKELIVPFMEEYKTKAYTASQFSKKVWESDDKNKRIQELQQLAQQK
ncbi:MAG TPA: hypothetical protein PK079_08250 [Leptospiraceae bacterium]|nr:hypothetical protein [Leptospiraceae bacterium]HMW06318.1 hypothetical protein [Leptospiraceae bacterium]HMX31003.1 hypothetical protein [Leptospiraceae bacterium]HMY32178.1 hypothetical protein [Leptospiraceae bacterium]HMZ63821.1 hypothetical protein [Leptospiraceae bacterium]